MRDQPARLPVDGLRRLLVMGPDNIGDVVLAGPALRALRQGFPAAEITLLLSPAGAQAAPLLPWIDDVLVDRVSWQQLPDADAAWDPRRDEALIAELRRRRYDAAFVLTTFSQSPWPAAYACLLGRIRIRVGRELGFGGALLTHAAPPLPDGTHQVERSLDLLESVGVPVRDRRLELRIPPAATAAAAALLEAHGIAPGTPYLVLAPGASCDARRLPARLSVGIARALRDHPPVRDWPIVLVGGPRDVAITAPTAAVDGVRWIAGQTTIPELAAVIAGARVLVTAHSVPMHLADATATPVVVAFSGTAAESEWAPRTSPARLVRRATACAPCRLPACPIGLPCLDLELDAVLRAVDEVLAATNADAPAAVAAAAEAAA
jgi:ADP-heptose:LPS heptosyltransferase